MKDVARVNLAMGAKVPQKSRSKPHTTEVVAFNKEDVQFLLKVIVIVEVYTLIPVPGNRRLQC